MLKIAWDNCYAHPLPEGHRFPMLKYELLPEQLIYEGSITESQLFMPDMIGEKEILSIHTKEYWDKLKGLSLSRADERRTGFPLSESLIRRERTIMQGTIECALHALEHSVSLNIAGGTHHAYTHRGEGFCLLNDLALAARFLIDQKRINKALIVDLDVHQGNGTAEIFKADARVFTFSMHGAKNYPLHKEESDLDIELDDGTDDKKYLETLNRILPELIDLVEPDMVFYQCGVDVLKEDKLGRLALSIHGCKERDRIVFERCKENHIPVVGAMGGGYAPDIKHIVEAHANTFRLAQEIYF